MKKTKTVSILIIALALLLAACTGKAASTQPAAGENGTANAPTSSAQQGGGASDLTKTDSQGAVTFEVKPTNLENPGDALIFDVSMNTHSVDLSMDLAALASLQTDNGRTVQATAWNGPKGGHHVEGKLSFPATFDGKPLLEGAKELTLTIKNVDAPSRTFTWQVAP